MFLKSINGGESWHFEVLDVNYDLHAITFADAERGLLVGQDGRVYRSEDGGATWRSGTAPGAVDLYAVSLQSDGRAWAAGQVAHFSIALIGGPLGQHRPATPLVICTLSNSSTAPLVSPQATRPRCLAQPIAEPRGIQLPPPIPSWANIYTLAFTSDQLGWIAGQAGLMQRTTDGGSSWQDRDHRTRKRFHRHPGPALHRNDWRSRRRHRRDRYKRRWR